MALFNVFSDPALRARQDVLDGQWNSARAVFGTCDSTPDSAFSEFTTDYNNWKSFYNSGSDWSTDSANATNTWQAQLKSWTDKFAQWGCTGNFTLTPGSVGADDAPEPDYIPKIKKPPPDQPRLLSRIGQQVKDGAQSFWSTLTTIGWVAVGLAILLGLGLIYLLTHVRVSTPQGSLG